MKQIPFLHQGSTIGIVAPARMVKEEEMQYAIDWLKEKGLVPVYDERLFAQHHIFAGDDSFRAAVFQEYLDNENIEAIWLARGGYGSIRMIDQLDFNKFLQHPKWIIGFSDGTVLHGKLNRLECPSMHGAMPFFFAEKTDEAKQSLMDAFLGKPLHYEFPAHPQNRLQSMEGVIAGGNLSVLCGMMGSNSFPDLDGKILFLEDVDEYIYQIDRLMHALKRAGKLANLKGLVVGGLTKIHDNAHPFGMTAEEVIAEAVAEYDYPVCFNFPAGHHDDNRPIVFGKTISLSQSGSSHSGCVSSFQVL